LQILSWVGCDAELSPNPIQLYSSIELIALAPPAPGRGLEIVIGTEDGKLLWLDAMGQAVGEVHQKGDRITALAFEPKLCGTDCVVVGTSGGEMAYVTRDGKQQGKAVTCGHFFLRFVFGLLFARFRPSLLSCSPFLLLSRSLFAVALLYFCRFGGKIDQLVATPKGVHAMWVLEFTGGH